MVFGYKEPEQEDLEKEGEDGDVEEEGVVVNVRDKEKERKGKREGRRPMMSEKGFMRPRDRSGSPDRSSPKGQGSLIPTTTPSRNHGESSKQNGSSRQSNYGNHKTNVDNGRSAGHSRGRESSTQVKLEPPSQSNKSTPQLNATPKSEGKNRKRKPSQSSSTDQARSKSNVGSSSVADKKPKLSPSMLNDYPTQSSIVESESNGKLDDREQALKAQKKKEKNARKKARKSAENA
jgi:hypothetical protein